MKIGIIEGSVRQGRASSAVARWVADAVATREGVTHEVLDLAEFNLPMVDSALPPMMLEGNYGHESVLAWSKAVASCDAFIFVAPEYNHSISGVLKNAIDWLAPEWMNKPAAVVGYGAAGGIRGVEALRLILANFDMHVIRAQGSLSIFTDFADGAVSVGERQNSELAGVVDQLVAVAGRCRG